MAHNQQRLKAKTSRIVKILETYLGTPKAPKRRSDPLDMLIATLLSQNTNDKNSHRAYLRLKETFPTWESVAHASRGEIASAIRTGGMANQKSKRIKNILSKIQQMGGGYNLKFLKKKTDEEVFEMLLSLDGIGIKTAACVLLFSLGRNVFPVDTHIHRICGRLDLSPDCRTPDETFERMKPLVPNGKFYSFHTNLIRFGRKICRANHPLCSVCPLFKECEYEKKDVYNSTPFPKTSNRDYNFMLLDNV